MKRLTAIAVTVVLCLSLLTFGVLAAEPAETSDNTQTGLAAGNGSDLQEALDSQKVTEPENEDSGIVPYAGNILIVSQHYYSSVSSVQVNAYCEGSGAWVGIYPASVTDYASTQSIVWYYCWNSSTQSYNKGYQAITKSNGILTWNSDWPSTTGAYKAVLFSDSGYTVAQTYDFFVGSVTLSTNKTTYCLNEPILVTTNYSKKAGWVGMYKSNVTPSASVSSVYWYYPTYLNSTHPGAGLSNVNLLKQVTGGTAYTTGTYTISVFEHNDGDANYNRLKSVNITITACADANKDHIGDACGTRLSNCADSSTDSDHKCDYCGKAGITSCSYDQSKVSSTYLKSAATCTAAAVYYKSCRCGAKGTATFTSGSALGHKYTSVVTAPTCTAGGYTTYTCSTCKHTYTDNQTAAKGHSYTSVVTAPTCTAGGYTTHTCSVCNDTYQDSQVAALGHTWTNATCTVPKTCSVCKATEGAALGHTETTVNASAATCEDTGYTGDTVCSVCDATIATGTEIAALGHDYTATVTPPTCTAAGYTTHVCSRDSSHTYTDGEVAASGHTWGEYTLTTAPTHEAAGQMTRSCGTCGAVDAEVITVKKLPAMELEVRFESGMLIITGIYDDYANKAEYLADLSHGILLIPTSAAGSADLSVTTTGRTMINFDGYKDDGTVRYYLTPSALNVSYTLRAFVAYADPVTGAVTYACSDLIIGDYTSNEGSVLTTVTAD